MKIPPVVSFFATMVLFVACRGREDGLVADPEIQFKQVNSEAWREVFFDSGSADWQTKWYLDGEKAKVINSDAGMSFMAGPIPRENASHAVLWTKDSFVGDLKIEYEYTRTDEANQFVTILYIQATGSGEGEYTKNIADWADKRKVPYMKTYYDYMHVYHISYSAYGPKPVVDDYDYIRARRYMPLLKQGLNNTEIKPDQYGRTGLFETGVPHQVTVIKKGRDLYMHIQNHEKDYLCHWVNSDLPVVIEGPIGFRHMFTRNARYRNIRISTLR